MVASASSSNTQWPSGLLAIEQRACGAAQCGPPKRNRFCRSSARMLRPGISVARPDRRRGARIEWHFRSWRASPYLSNRRPGRDCCNRVLASGPPRVLLGRGGKGRAPLAHDLPGRQFAAAGRSRPRPRSRSSAPARRAACRCRRSPALMVIATRPGKANTHSVVPLSSPRIGGWSGAGSMRKCALTMARNSVGVSRPGTSAAAA